MCQLLGMNCNTPTDIVFSFEGFRRRAGLTDCHSDGFGIAFFEGRGVRIFRDNHAASQSPIADCVKQYNIKSLNVIAHIRKATQGGVTIENTHPFIREIWGQNWVFAHNWLFASSLCLGLAYKHSVGDVLKEQTTTHDYNLKNFNVDAVGRLGVVWNNTRYYVGSSAIFHAYNYQKGQFSTSTIFGNFNIYVGVNFGKRKQK